ncbi:MAG: type II toxin-antitoxin system ParD family antitoxin [Nostoc sp.]|uniref:type II toxin-antitoxin system ParD family antitoxin n=1 Tax=Nostoc sp. TaxID=1180 RepID=UPI002FF7C8BD
MQRLVDRHRLQLRSLLTRPKIYANLSFCYLKVEALVQRQLTSGKYQNAIKVILTGIKLLEQQEDIYQGRLQDLQQEACVGWEASERGKVVDGSTAIAQIRANVRSLPLQASWC